MKAKLFYPSKVWTFAMFSSALISAIIFGIIEQEWEVSFSRFVLQIGLGYSVGIILYFIWVILVHRILRTVQDYFRKKIFISLLAIVFSLIIFLSLLPFTHPKDNTYFLFDYFSFGGMLIAGVWLYAIEFELPEGNEEILDDIFQAL